MSRTDRAPGDAVADQQIRDLLATAKRALGLSVTFLTRMDGTTQHLERVDSSVPFLFKEGYQQRQERTLCQAIRDGELPAVIPDLRQHPAAMRLPAARFPRIRSYVSVPVVFSDGTVYGTFCGAGLTTDKGLAPRDQALMDVLAQAAALVLEPAEQEKSRVAEITSRLAPVVQGGGPLVVLQPIAALATGLRVGAEALSRFPAEWGKAPDVCFQEAHSVGQGDHLELLALRRAGAHLDRVSGYVAMNVSPATLLTAECRAVLDALPLERVLLELSEHDPVEDYDALDDVLAPLRARGLRLAIDDVGAGFSSLRHIVLTSPDVIKLDRTLVDGLSANPVLATLVRSLVQFGHGAGAAVVAEGVETADDAAVLRDFEVDYAQGWHVGRPGAPEQLRDHYELLPDDGPRPAPPSAPAAPRSSLVRR
jgi:EAL domain-containing protein (putative c-di-GMP-specific phosphodiesterase class I)